MRSCYKQHSKGKQKSSLLLHTLKGREIVGEKVGYGIISDARYECNQIQDPVQ